MMRRALMWLSVAAAAAVSLSAAAVPTAPADVRSPTWHLARSDQFRLPPPPASTSITTRREIAELLRLQSTRTVARRRVALDWNGAPAVVPWTKLALELILKFRPRPAAAARALALLETGMYDAMVAAGDSRRAHADHSRPPPARLAPALRPLLMVRTGSSYAPAEAAIAGAAEKLLAHLFPKEPVRTFGAAANAAVESRLWAGLNYRSDVERARALGGRVAGLVIERATSDGFENRGFSNPRPAGDVYWDPTPPQYEPAIGGPVGTWRTWLLRAAGEFRAVIPGPSTYGSPAFMREVAKVLSVRATLTDKQKQTAFFWADGSGTYTPPGHWFDVAMQLVATYRPNLAQTVTLFAALGAAEADAAIAFFEAKYHWWSIRPVTAIWRLCEAGTRLCTEAEIATDPERASLRGRWYPLFETPAFPSYPSGHATFSGAASQLLTYAFPGAGTTLDALAAEAANSRLYAGIHFDEDDQDGLRLGRAIGHLAISWAKLAGLRPIGT